MDKSESRGHNVAAIDHAHIDSSYNLPIDRPVCLDIRPARSSPLGRMFYKVINALRYADAQGSVENHRTKGYENGKQSLHMDPTPWLSPSTAKSCARFFT